MKLQHKILLAVAILMIGLSLILETDGGQNFLRGPEKPNESHFEADDRYMGAAWAPIAYGLVPGILLLIYDLSDIAAYRVRLKAQQKDETDRRSSA